MDVFNEFPEDYHPLLGLRQTELAIRQIKEFFQTNLAFELNLIRVTAPLFVLSGTGINDDLNGVERPVVFPVKSMQDSRAEIVQSLAKWKRLQLADFGMQPGEGLYTDMNAIRPDEVLDNSAFDLRRPVGLGTGDPAVKTGMWTS